jgi:hypothetical protein
MKSVGTLDQRTRRAALGRRQPRQQMQRGHALDAEARSYVRLDSPALLHKTWEEFQF